MTPSVAAPPGFVRFIVDRADVVCSAPLEHALRAALARGTLYDYARLHPDARRHAGRGPVFAVSLPGDAARVVVRRNRHGGALAGLTRELWRPPGRALRELAIAERLRAAGVPTPEFVAYAVYPAPLGLSRIDVATREIPEAFDLGAALLLDDAAIRDLAWDAAIRLIATLSDAGARHEDLNVKNVLLRRSAPDTLDAVVLDVDRISFGGDPRRVLEMNLARLLRSARKWRDTRGAKVSEADLSAIARRAQSPEPAARARTP